MSDNDFLINMERASLLKDRWYLIFRQGSMIITYP